MNLNREQCVRAVERGQALLAELKKDYPELGLSPVFSRFGLRSGQCALTTDLKKIVIEFPEMLNVDAMPARLSLSKSSPHSPHIEKSFSHEKAQKNTKKLRELLKAHRKAEQDAEKQTASNLWKEAAEVERVLLDPELEIYCGNVLIEYRPGNLKYEPLRRLQQDARLPPGLNEIGNGAHVSSVTHKTGGTVGTTVRCVGGLRAPERPHRLRATRTVRSS